MGSKSKSLEILEPVSGSFVASTGERLTYAMDAGNVAESDVHPELVARLIRAGSIKTANPKPEASENGEQR